MIIREATERDVKEAGALYGQARKYMAENGNPYQWQTAYPSEEDVLSDIPKKSSFVVEECGEIIGVFHFHVGDDDTYAKIYNGEWKNSDPYAVIHRVAVKYHGKGIANFIYAECYKRYPNLKIDTHKDNLPMQKSLEKNGFEYCGIVYLPSGEERLAYQKCDK